MNEQWKHCWVKDCGKSFAFLFGYLGDAQHYKTEAFVQRINRIFKDPDVQDHIKAQPHQITTCASYAQSWFNNRLVMDAFLDVLQVARHTPEVIKMCDDLLEMALWGGHTDGAKALLDNKRRNNFPQLRKEMFYKCIAINHEDTTQMLIEYMEPEDLNTWLQNLPKKIKRTNNHALAYARSINKSHQEHSSIDQAVSQTHATSIKKKM